MSIAQDKLWKPMIVGREPSRLVYYTAASQRNFPFMVRWSFLLCVVSIACDMWSSAKLTGLLFFAIYVLYCNPFFGKRSFQPVPRVLMWFMAYLAVCLVNGLFLPTERLGEFLPRLFTLIQMSIFFWIASDILKEERMAKKALLAFCIASVTLALGLLLSVPGFAITGELGTERASVIGISANALASIAAVATVGLLGLWLNLSRKRLIESVLMLGSLFALLVATVYTGSRGGVLMLMVGLSVYTVPYWKNRWRISSVIFALIAIAGLAYIAITTPIFYSRWLEAYEGPESSRDRIYQEGIVMVSERPLLGWQPIEFQYELGSRTGARTLRDAHNIYLHLLLEVGVVGAVPFLIGLWLCGQRAWKARNGFLGLLPLAMLITVLVGGMSNTWIYTKPEWFALAFTTAVTGERKRSRTLLVRRPVDDGQKTSSLKLNSST